MTKTTIEQGIISAYYQDDYLLTWIEAFLVDRKAQNLSKGTLEFYRKKIQYFVTFCEGQAIDKITQITPLLIREFLISLENAGHNPGGVHACYRTLKSFLFWWEEEVEPDNWKNPIKKVKPPKVAIEPLDPVEINDVKAMIEICSKNTFTGLRDKAILLSLLDSGLRASEFVSIKLDDINPITGEILIRQGKGGKPRTVYLGSKSRKSLRSYLKIRKDTCNYLWITDENEPLTYSGLRMVMRRRSESANVNTPSLHAFRRWFAITCLRNGMDIYTLQNLMGHADLQVLRRYLKQTDCDLRLAHSLINPVDSL